MPATSVDVPKQEEKMTDGADAMIKWKIGGFISRGLIRPTVGPKNLTPGPRGVQRGMHLILCHTGRSVKLPRLDHVLNDYNVYE